MACFTTTWRNKFLTIDAASLPEMASKLAEAAAELRAMAAAGVTLADDGGVADDYATLVTTDAAVAPRFGLEREGDEEDDEDVHAEALDADDVDHVAE